MTPELLNFEYNHIIKDCQQQYHFRPFSDTRVTGRMLRAWSMSLEAFPCKVVPFRGVGMPSDMPESHSPDVTICDGTRRTWWTKAM